MPLLPSRAPTATLTHGPVRLALKKHTARVLHAQLYRVPMAPSSLDLRDIGDEQKCVLWSEDKEEILLGPYKYLYGHPGKNIRAQLVGAFNMCLKVPTESVEVITTVVEMLHTASLLVDDIEDSSLLRRGVPVANHIFGTAQVINSANYVYFLALQELMKLSNPAMIEAFAEELLNLHRGQGMDIYWRDSLTCPSEADYLKMVANKTGGLFRLVIRLLQADSKVDIDCVPIVNTIGLLFQILDDHLNLSTYTPAKGLCEDLTEGKFSFLIIHAIRADPSNLVLINVLKRKTADKEVKEYAVTYMERMGSFEYSKKCIAELNSKASSMVDGLERKLGVDGKEGVEAIRGFLARLVI